jgi:hypothetical protein
MTSGKSTPRQKRTRRGVEVTLSDLARTRLDALAGAETGSLRWNELTNRSAIVEALIHYEWFRVTGEWVPKECSVHASKKPM